MILHQSGMMCICSPNRLTCECESGLPAACNSARYLGLQHRSGFANAYMFFLHFWEVGWVYHHFVCLCCFCFEMCLVKRTGEAAKSQPDVFFPHSDHLLLTCVPISVNLDTSSPMRFFTQLTEFASSLLQCPSGLAIRLYQTHTDSYTRHF